MADVGEKSFGNKEQCFLRFICTQSTDSLIPTQKTSVTLVYERASPWQLLDPSKEPENTAATQGLPNIQHCASSRSSNGSSDISTVLGQSSLRLHKSCLKRQTSIT